MGEDKANKVEINIYDGGQGNFAFDNGEINAVQTNSMNIKNYNRHNIAIDKKFQNSRKQEYINNWNKPLFLHPREGEDSLKLADAFIMPDYNVHKKIQGMGFLNNDTLVEVINKFIKYYKTLTMLITGVPGIGKTSIVSWIANKYKEDDKVIILRFRDWKVKELQDGLINAICNTFYCENEDLENKVLILDGFDEMKPLYIREKLLNDFLNDIKDFDNFKCIVTSRLGYIDSSFYFQNIFELKEFNARRVENFYRIITGRRLDKEEIIKSNLKVLGIPVILYMAIMTNVNISKNPTKPELYSSIFAEQGGIFDKFDVGGTSYDNGIQILRYPENIKKYLKFLQEIAFNMFQKNDLVLQIEVNKIPKLQFQGNFISILEFPIKHLFENTETNIEFIHKSIYEYFVSEYIYTIIEEAINENVPKEKLAGIFGDTFWINNLSKEILEFLKFRIRNRKLSSKFDVVKDVFELMLKNGMTYYTNKKYKSVIKCEMNVFANMLQIIHLWEIKNYVYLGIAMNDFLRCEIIDFSRLNLGLMYLGEINLMAACLRRANLANVNLTKANLIQSNLEKANLMKANLREVDLWEANLREANLREANLMKANLREVDLREANLIQINLREADLRGTDLRGADLRKSDLRSINLREADLRGADLREADLWKADLIQVDLREADLRGADLREADLTEASLTESVFDEKQISYLGDKYNLQEVKVYIEKIEKIMRYEEYCNKKKKI